MVRFLAMVVDPASTAQVRHVEAWSADLLSRYGWGIAFDSPALRLFCHGDPPHSVVQMDEATGLVVGNLFRHGEEHRGKVSRLDGPETHTIRTSEGHHLITNYWGAYIAFYRDPDGRTVTVLRDPCGAPPCFMMQANGATLVCSHVFDLASLQGIELSIDWEQLKAFLLFSYFITPHTGLCEIKEVLAGERVALAPGQAPARSWAWSAPAIAVEARQQDFMDAAMDLREISERCFAAWGRAYPSALVELSGGLDSSVLLNLLRRVSDADIHALHFVGVDYEGYECALARLAARNAGVPLIEIPLRPEAADLRSMLEEPVTARPTQQVFGLPTDLPVHDAFERTRAHVLMAGHGGDSLFLQRTLAERTLDDYRRLNGIDRRFWTTAYDAACLQERPVWTPLSQTLMSLGQKKTSPPFAFLDARIAAGHCILTSEAVASIDDGYKMHAWLKGAEALPPCKAAQVGAIIALYGYHPQRGAAAGRALSPWFSQPIAEFALRTPSYLFCEGGIDRALERHAFADLIPEAIARRFGKGLIDHQLLEMVRRNARFMRELVLDGELIRLGWFDRGRVDHFLSDEQLLEGRLSGLYSLVAAEAWLAAWRRRATIGERH